jgi:6-phosphogluconolactonase
MNTRSVVRAKNPETLAVLAADYIVEQSHNAIRDHGIFTLVLSGGATPELTYSLLAQPERHGDVPWSKTFIFFGDERFVPHTDTRSNFGMAFRTLLGHVPIPATRICSIPTQYKTAAEAASVYAERLAGFFAKKPGDPPPQFDLVLLGMGDDGHTASLFPNSPGLDVTDTWVIANSPGLLPEAVERITLTYPILNAARHVAFLVTGQKKASALQAILKGQADPKEYPAAGIDPVDGTLTWFVDDAAAGQPSRK